MKRLLLSLLVASALALPASVYAGRTEPLLALTDVQPAVDAGAVVLRFEGTVVAEDLVQLAYPLQLLVWEQTATPVYVRYDLINGPVTGSDVALADGVSAPEAQALLVLGTPLAGGDVVFVGPGRIDVRIPAGIVSGPVSAAVYVLDTGSLVLSNTLSIVIPGAGP